MPNSKCGHVWYTAKGTARHECTKTILVGQTKHSGSHVCGDCGASK